MPSDIELPENAAVKDQPATAELEKKSEELNLEDADKIAGGTLPTHHGT